MGHACAMHLVLFTLPQLLQGRHLSRVRRLHLLPRSNKRRLSLSQLASARSGYAFCRLLCRLSSLCARTSATRLPRRLRQCSVRS